MIYTQVGNCCSVETVDNTTPPTKAGQLEFGSISERAPFPDYVSTRSVQSNVDTLIDWYERFNPGVRTVAVNCRPATLRKFCKKNGVRGGPWLYRNREIVPMRKSRAAEPQE
jgi:hypothetical protein